MANNSKTSNKPVQKYGAKGVSASVFANTVDGKDAAFFKTQIVRTYKDKEGFKSVPTYSPNELPLVMLAAWQAWTFILDREREARKNQESE